MTTPLVEMDGDEMTRILWQMIKDELLLPYIDLKTEYYDLGLEHRNETDDQVTVDSANATLKYGVAVKCATITPNAARMTEYNLKEMWKSPNGTIRAILDGTVFRAPILVKGIVPYVKNWTKPITIARHAYGDVYKNTEIKVPGPGKAELVFTAADGTETRELIHNFDGAGIIQGIHNTNKSIESFARACFSYAVDTKQDLWFSTKDTISKKYDHTFKDIFQEIYDNEYKAKFEELGIEYFYTLIDDAVARVIRSEGGFIWACKNYDGDVMSDMVATAYGDLSMMTSVLVSPSGLRHPLAAHPQRQLRHLLCPVWLCGHLPLLQLQHDAHCPEQQQRHHEAGGESGSGHGGLPQALPAWHVPGARPVCPPCRPQADDGRRGGGPCRHRARGAGSREEPPAGGQR